MSIAANQLVFDPGLDFDVLDNGDTALVTVAYTMSDDESAGASSTAIITVTGVSDAIPNTAPTANSDTGSGSEDAT